MIIKETEKPNPEKHNSFVYLFTKLNAKPGEKQFYCGYHLEKPNDNYSHTSTDDDLDLDIDKHDFKKEILHWGTMSEMQTKEHTILKNVDARNNPEWYNKTNGAPGKNVKEIDLLFISDMADKIRDTYSYEGIKPVIRQFEKKKMRAEISKEFSKLQVRAKDVISKTKDQIASWLDKKNILGSIKALKERENINLLVVVLKDIEVTLKDGTKKIVDLIVGGNHTLEGTFSSKHGKQIQFLTIPKEIHGLDYNMAVQLGSFLNKPDKQPHGDASEDDIIKQGFNLCKEYGYTTKSETIEELLDLNGCDPVQKIAYKTGITKMFSKLSLANTLWKTYDSEEGKAEIEKKKNDLQKMYPHAKIVSSSSGFCEPGKTLITMFKEINAGIFYNAIIWVLHHPNPKAEIKWKTEFLDNNQQYVEMNCDAFINKFPKITEMQCLFIDMDTTKSDLN